MALVIIIIVIIASLAVFYLKCSMMQSLTTLWSSVLAVIIAFSYYEIVAELFISRGYVLEWAQVICFVILLVVSFGILRTVSDFLIRVKIDLGEPAILSMKIGCGLLTGFIISGAVLTALGLAPLQVKLLYSRFNPESPVTLNRPNKPAVNTDGFVASLYSLTSSGSLSSGKSFGVLHADYLTQIHLNKLKVKEDVLPVCSRKTLTLRTGKNRKPIRQWEIPGVGDVVVIRVGIAARKVEDGGANDATGRLIYFPAQFRLITKPNDETETLQGKATALYPKGFLKQGNWTETPLEEVITPESREITNRVHWVDVAFEVPSGQKPALLEFKQNAVIDLSSYTPVKTSPEIESALDNDAQEEPEA